MKLLEKSEQMDFTGRLPTDDPVRNSSGGFSGMLNESTNKCWLKENKFLAENSLSFNFSHGVGQDLSNEYKYFRTFLLLLLTLRTIILYIKASLHLDLLRIHYIIPICVALVFTCIKLITHFVDI